MRSINYHATSILWLSLEPYHNAGIPPERTKELIEQIRDPGSASGGRLWCESQGVNYNWNVRTMATDPVALDGIVSYIRFTLENELRRIADEAPNDSGAIWRCTWCGRDTPTRLCAHCENDCTYDRTKPHQPQWSRKTKTLVECKVCDREAPYSAMAEREMCNPQPPYHQNEQDCTPAAAQDAAPHA